MAWIVVLPWTRRRRRRQQLLNLSYDTKDGKTGPDSSEMTALAYSSIYIYFLRFFRAF